MKRLFIFLFLQIALFAADYDCIVVGTSPFSLIEALYQKYSGKSVIILEAEPTCGGAWKTIEICGVPNAELGCHSIPSGNDVRLKNFLEEYIGCNIVSIDNPPAPFIPGKCPNGWYFSKGCFELVDQLLYLISIAEIEIKTNSKVEEVSILNEKKEAKVKTANQIYTTNKLILTPMSSLLFPDASVPQITSKSKHYHLYMLIDDPNPPTFSYRGGIAAGISRMMNMTPFIGLTGSGKQLIAIQTYNETYLQNEKIYLDALKTNRLIDPNACIIRSESYIYETGHFSQNVINKTGAQGIVEVLQTGVLPSMNSYITKWKTAIRPYREITEGCIKSRN